MTLGLSPHLLDVFQPMNLVRTLDIVEGASAAMVKLGALAAT
jgi:hypothetical protein